MLVNVAVEGVPVGRLLHSPYVNLRPDGPGRVLLHRGSIDRRLEDGADDDFLAHELLERARRVVPALGGATFGGVRIGVRSMPEDGLPCVGAVSWLPGYYEAVAHSGVTLGPLLGRLLAREILDGAVDALVAPFRPARYARDL
jgi:glycine/D-amino acid oxidase-like deaminating enzyme